MDPQVQGSFIPKKPLDTGARRSGGVGLLFLIALLIFIASLVAAGAAFAYQQYLTGQLASKAASLKADESAFDPGAIEDLVRIDGRINNAMTLLTKHAAASGLFSFLATQTLQSVAWNKLDYSLQSDGSAKISLSGTADSFSTVALQSDQFGASKLLKDVVFSGITVGAKGGVSFDVDATVDPSLILYSNALGQAAAPAPAAPGLIQNQPGQATTTQ
jgi:hypothetical protein